MAPASALSPNVWRQAALPAAGAKRLADPEHRAVALAVCGDGKAGRPETSTWDAIADGVASGGEPALVRGFVSEALFSGRRFRMLAVVDDLPAKAHHRERESPLICVHSAEAGHLCNLIFRCGE